MSMPAATPLPEQARTAIDADDPGQCQQAPDHPQCISRERHPPYRTLPMNDMASMNDMESVNHRYENLLEDAGKLPAIVTAVAHPCEKSVLETVVEARRLNLIEPILVGPIAKIHSVAAAAGIDLGNIEIIDTPHSHAAAEQAVALVRSGR